MLKGGGGGERAGGGQSPPPPPPRRSRTLPRARSQPPLPDALPSKRGLEAGGAAAFEADAAAAAASTSPVAPLRPTLCACCGRPKRARRQAADGGPTAALPLPSPQPAPPAPPRHPAVARLLEEETAGVVAGAVAVATTARPSPLPRRAPTSFPGTPRPRRRVDRVIRYQCVCEAGPEAPGNVTCRALPPSLSRTHAHTRPQTPPPPLHPREFQSAWAADPFLAVGGDDRHPHRPRGALAAAFAAEHAALAKAGWSA